MADINKKILLEVSVKDQDAALKQAAELRKEISGLTEEQSKLISKLNEKGKLNNKESIELERITAQLGNLKKEYREVQRVASAYEQTQTRGIGSYKQLNALIQIEETKLKNLNGTLQRNAEGQLILTDEYEAQKKAVEELNKVRIQFDQGIKVGRTNVGNYAGSILEATERIKQLDDFIMNSGVDMGSQEFKDARDEADKLKLSIDQALGKVDEFGNREPRNPAKKVFDDAFESTVALSGAMGILTSLFSKNENVQESLAKAMQAVAIAQAAANILKAKGAILDTAEIVSKKVQIGLQRTYALVVGESTGALKAFRIALAATGIGLAVLAVGALAGAFSKKGGLTETTDDQTDAQDKLNDAIQRTNDIIEDIKTQFNNPVEGIYAQQILDLQRLIDLRKAQGATDEEITQKSIELDQLKIKNVQLIMNAIEDMGVAGQTTTIELQGQIDDLTNDIAIAQAELDRIAKERAEALLTIEEQNEENRIKLMTDGFRQERLLFELHAKQRIREAEKSGLDVNLVEQLIDKERQQMIADQNSEIEAMKVKSAEFEVETEKQVTDRIFAEHQKRFNQFVADSEARKAKLQEELEFTTSLMQQIGMAFANSIDEAGVNLEKFAQALLTILLDTLEKSVIASIAETTAKQIAAGGVVGIFKAAALTGLITAAFESAKALINRPVDVKLEQGGAIDIGGKRHADGGTKFVGEDGTRFEAEAGEKLFVVNRGASSFLDALGVINNAFRTKPAYSRPNYLADGGFVMRRIKDQALSGEMMERAFTKAIMKMKPQKLIISELKEAVDSADKSIENSEL